MTVHKTILFNLFFVDTLSLSFPYRWRCSTIQKSRAFFHARLFVGSSNKMHTRVTHLVQPRLLPFIRVMYSVQCHVSIINKNAWGSIVPIVFDSLIENDKVCLWDVRYRARTRLLTSTYIHLYVHVHSYSSSFLTFSFFGFLLFYFYMVRFFS